MKLAPKLLEELRREACQAAPFECCGILWAKANSDVVCEFTPYAGPLYRHRFAMRDEWLLAQHYRGRARGLRALGYYHSHNGSGVEPSRADLKGHPPGSYCLIVDSGGAVRMLRVPPL